MIKVCNNKNKSIKIGSTTIPANSSIVVTTLPSITETERLLKKGVITVTYVTDNVITDNISNQTPKNDSNSNSDNIIVANEEITHTRRRRAKKESNLLSDNVENITVSDDTNVDETTATKGDMNNASD